MTDQKPIAPWARRIANGERLTAEEARSLAGIDDPDALCQAAAAVRDQGFGNVVTVSRKVFIPLTRLCRDATTALSRIRRERAKRRS